jgi:non-ribosomal peptide synthetase component F
VALDDGEESWTYGELAARMRRLARRLRRLGVGPESVVGLCAERSCGLVLGMLAVLEAGGAFLPLDPEYPLARLRLLLEDSGTRLVLADGRGSTRLAGLGDPALRLLPLEAGPGSGERDGEGEESAATNLASPAYVLYTSGSTGRPKGVVIPHRGLANLARIPQRLFGARTAGAPVRVAELRRLGLGGEPGSVRRGHSLSGPFP